MIRAWECVNFSYMWLSCEHSNRILKQIPSDEVVWVLFSLSCLWSTMWDCVLPSHAHYFKYFWPLQAITQREWWHAMKQEQISHLFSFLEITRGIFETIVKYTQKQQRFSLVFFENEALSVQSEVLFYNWRKLQSKIFIL